MRIEAQTGVEGLVETRTIQQSNRRKDKHKYRHREAVVAGVGVEAEEEDTTTLPGLQHLKRIQRIKMQHPHQVGVEEVDALAEEDLDLARAWQLEGDSLVGN